MSDSAFRWMSSRWKIQRELAIGAASSHERASFSSCELLEGPQKRIRGARRLRSRVLEALRPVHLPCRSNA